MPYDPTLEQFNGPAAAGARRTTSRWWAWWAPGQVGARVLAALAANGATPDDVPTFVTDGLRRSDLGGLIDPRQPMASVGIQGVSPLAEPRDAAFEDAFAAASPEHAGGLRRPTPTTA